MAKLDWTRAKRLKPDIPSPLAAPAYRAARSWHPPKPERRQPIARPPLMQTKTETREISIVVGADRSKTGQREAHIFPTLEAAHKAGFTWAI